MTGSPGKWDTKSLNFLAFYFLHLTDLKFLHPNCTVWHCLCLDVSLHISLLLHLLLLLLILVTLLLMHCGTLKLKLTVSEEGKLLKCTRQLHLWWIMNLRSAATVWFCQLMTHLPQEQQQQRRRLKSVGKVNEIKLLLYHLSLPLHLLHWVHKA